MAKVALITGAARRIGAEITRTLHQHGFHVIIHCRRSTTDAADLAVELNRLRPDSARVLSANLNDPAAVRELGAAAQSQWGHVDVLVNNASSFYPTPLDSATDDDWDALLHSNLRAPFILIQTLAETLRAQRGAVVNLIDVYAEKPLAGHSLYCIAKAGLATLTRSLARELGPHVRINGISPGPILWPEAGQGNQQDILDATALGRCGTPADIAGAVAWLALDAPYVTGQILAVDGGRSLAFQGG
ncbi:dehydrogenase/reductase [Alcanivorax sp. S71-1-4]|uniref:pteridine reductase n=1 Tax=Alcanivorax sp. S71-1-4 TaxID=1177159 RepID=UPI001358BD26|nr:pteridine reductase [Alcanivorax sp. S71-1-4]KAF0810618.1 dehydrogenase/reductase [Alcanivorax sp. S71-1-4]